MAKPGGHRLGGAISGLREATPQGGLNVPGVKQVPVAPGNPVVLAPPQGLRVGTLGDAMLRGAYLHSHRLFPISNVTPLGES